MESALTTLTVEAKRLTASPDEAAKRKLIDGLRDLQLALESSEETMQRLIYSNLTIASIRVSLDLKIFDMLVESQEPISVSALAERSKSDPVLLARFLRHQASMGMIKKVAQDSFQANLTTENLAQPNIQAGLYFCNDVLGPAFQAIPEFLAERKYQNPDGLLDTPFHKAWKTDLSLWEWVYARQRETAYFNKFMLAQRSSVKNCFSFFPLEEECKGWPAEKPVFVDVGGGTGQQCMVLKEMYPNLPGKVILQDLPAVIAQAKVSDGIQAMEHDFFTPQPIKGAKFYYLRAIMHGHADAKCLEILKNILEAMTEDSALLLDEIVVPNEKVDWYVTQTDLAMMAQFSSIERTEQGWKDLLAKAGLKVQSITTYTYSFKLSIIKATKYY